MKKSLTSAVAVIFFSLFGLASSAFAQALTNRLAYGDVCSLLLKGIIPVVAKIIGALGSIMIIVAGIFYLTSAGSPERIGVAKKALIYAIAGIVIAIAAAAIVEVIKTALNVAGATC